MTTTYLVGVDGSEASHRAAAFAAQRAKASGAKLLVAHVIEWSPYSFNTPEENEERHQRREEELERARSHIMEPQLAELRAQGIEVEGLMHHGHPAELLCSLAEEAGAAQIFIGRRGHSRMSALLFGSIAGSLVQAAPVPVTVVP
jgi:nucleotide-binding universal stress UspA family protein